MATDEPAETLAGVGEFAVIDRLVTGRDQPVTVALGPGDDAAVVVAADGRTVVSTDMLVAGRHFRLDWSTPHDVGRAEVVAKQLAELAGVRSAEYVTGPYDVVARIGADTMSDLQDTVVPNVKQVAGITRTLTCPIADGARP